MKKILTLLAILFSSTMYAQNNLQFNATKYIKFTIASNEVTKDTTITIPTDKVWKIESVSISYQMTSLNLDGVQIAANPLNGGVYTPAPNTACPIWLPSGTYTVTLKNYVAAGQGNAFISAIEFNLVP